MEVALRGRSVAEHRDGHASRLPEHLGPGDPDGMDHVAAHRDRGRKDVDTGRGVATAFIARTPEDQVGKGIAVQLHGCGVPIRGDEPVPGLHLSRRPDLSRLLTFERRIGGEPPLALHRRGLAIVRPGLDHLPIELAEALEIDGRLADEIACRREQGEGLGWHRREASGLPARHLSLRRGRCAPAASHARC